ncbi:unnamed protein product [Cuscuta europaea]|uniref:Cytochrome b6-f complex subunit 7 n=1 Tax=Cuscuta europaea TaxID=41803 RepID=A0A9P0Z129_CUSEU|nr:unnamed protein product [Cuscuta europaea]
MLIIKSTLAHHSQSTLPLKHLPTPSHLHFPSGERSMASTSLSQAIAVTGTSFRPSRRRTAKVNYITGLNSFVGLKAQNQVTRLGLPVSAEESFAKIVGALREPSRGGGRCGGALSSTCNYATAEIFKIAAIIPGLVLVGVAVGFALLRVEAIIEEAE